MNTQIKCPRCGTRYSTGETATTFCPQCAFAAAVTAPLEIEAEADGLLAHLSGLAQVERLGRGGMGVVYRARQTRLERDVAVKVISSDFASDPDFQARFQQEARILASLDHPNIVAIHDCGIEGGLEYFVMEFVEGSTVRRLLEKDALADPLRVALDVSSALAYAHERGVIHRDIKPENILLRADGRVKVVDFGIARIGMGAPRLTVTDAVVGTPAYMAPEQRENPAAVDHRVDVYALGLLTAEMLTGKGPTEGALELAGVDQAVKEVILRATERDPARRYQTMKEMSAAIRALVEPEADGGAPPRLPMRERVARLAASRLFWVLATGAAFQVVFLLAHLVDTLPPDPRATFEQLVRAGRFGADEPLHTLKDKRIHDEVGALLDSEAGGPDEARAWAAVRAAYDLHLEDAVPPDVRARAMLRWGGRVEPLNPGSLDWFPDDVSARVALAMREAGPAFASGVFDDLVGGKIPADRHVDALCGLSVTAGPALVRKMRDFLVANPKGDLAKEVLFAFATRVHLPVPEWTEGAKSIPDALLEAYVRRLPRLLDEGSAEVDWARAIELVAELQRVEGLEYCVQHWLDDFGRCGDATPTPQEALARSLKVAWPLDDAAARAMELRLRAGDEPWWTFARALLLKWRRTGRTAIPYNTITPHPAHPRSDPIERGLDAARELLDETSASVPWEAFGVLFLTIAGAPVELDPVSGEGPVRAKMSHVVPADAREATLHIGMRTVVARAARRAGWPFDLTLEGDLVGGKDGACRFTGTNGQRFGGGWGSSSGERDCQPGEAAVLHAGLVGGSTDGLRYRSFTLLVPEPATTGDASQRWRVALAAAIEQESAGKESRSEFQLGERIAIAAWTPLPEAAKALSVLWARHADLQHPIGGVGHGSPEAGDLVGAALLMIGDAAPLEDGGLLKRLPPELLMRIRLFSSSPSIRRAAVGGEKAIESLQDAEAVESRLAELGESDPAIASRIAEVRRGEPSPVAGALWRYLALLAAAIVFGCLLPWRALRGTALAHAFAFLGLALRFVTVDIGGHVWFPAAGDLLIVVSAFLYGGWVLRSLAVALAVSGVLGFMMPDSFVRECVSGLLLCAYVAAVSLDFLSRRLPGRTRRRDVVALCATWWALVAPMGLLYASLLVLGLMRDEVSITLVSFQGYWGVLYVAAMTLGPLWLLRASRLAARRA